MESRIEQIESAIYRLKEKSAEFAEGGPERNDVLELQHGIGVTYAVAANSVRVLSLITEELKALRKLIEDGDNLTR